MKSIVNGKSQIQVTMKSKIFALSVVYVVFFSGTVLANSAPVVANVTAEQHGQDVLIRYDLADANDDLCTVSVQGSDDNGLAWNVPVTTLSSDVGPNIPSGAGNHIIWHCRQDLPGIFGTQYKVSVIADDGIETGSAVSPTFRIDTRQNAWCEGADINLDGNINFMDLAIFVGYWLKVRPDPPDDMVFIPSGECELGDHYDTGIIDEKPVHLVYIESFYMSRYETTNQQYSDFLNSAKSQGLIEVRDGLVYAVGQSRAYFDTYNHSIFSQIEYSGGVFSARIRSGYNMGNHPVGDVSWYGAAAYCNWRSQQEGYESCYDLSTWACDFSKKGYRLATEAQWEYAARGGCSNPYYKYPWCDNSIDCSKANHFSTSGRCNPLGLSTMPYTSPVGYFSANGYGLYDMAGNVWEWCNDLYSSTYYGVCPYDNPTGPVSAIYRVLRGGSWDAAGFSCRVSTRYNFAAGGRSSGLGFRVVMDLN